MEQKALPYVIIITSIVILLLLVIFGILFTYFQKKKMDFIIKQKEQEKQFDKTLKKSQIEIQESALKNIAWELHDNVGQLLSLARLELNILQPQLTENSEKVKEISNIIGDSLQEIRSISKTLNAEVINNMGIIESIQVEINRFNKLKFIETQFEVKGEVYDIPQKDEIILFRMIQEFFSNTIKHSKATKLHVTIEYLPDMVKFCVNDNGQGFDITKAKKGSGLINIKSRASLINTKLIYNSSEDGTQMNLNYPTKKIKNYENK